MKRRRAKWPWIEWRSEHLTLRPLKLRDANEVYRALQDPALRQFQYSPSAPTRFGALLFCLKVKWKMWRREAVYYARFLRSNGRLVSIATYMGIDPYDPHTAEMGVWWVKDLWGTDLRKESQSGIFQTFMYEEVGVRRIVYRIDERNTHVLGMMQRSRSRFEGVHRDDRFDGERYWDTYQWSSQMGSPEALERMRLTKLKYGWPPKWPGDPDIDNRPYGRRAQ